MRAFPLVLLISAAVLALVSLPLLVLALPFGLALLTGALLLTLLATPDLADQDQDNLPLDRVLE